MTREKIVKAFHVTVVTLVVVSFFIAAGVVWTKTILWLAGL